MLKLSGIIGVIVHCIVHGLELPFDWFPRLAFAIRNFDVPWARAPKSRYSVGTCHRRFAMARWARLCFALLYIRGELNTREKSMDVSVGGVFETGHGFQEIEKERKGAGWARI